PPLYISAEQIDGVRAQMPELPRDKQARYQSELQLSAYDAALLTTHRATADYFEAVVDAVGAAQAKLAANWVSGELASALNREELDIEQAKVSPTQLAGLIARIADQTISNKIARDVFQAMWEGEHDGQADAIIDAKGLKQITDTGAIAAMVDEVLAANPAMIEQYRAGRDKAFNA